MPRATPRGSARSFARYRGIRGDRAIPGPRRCGRCAPRFVGEGGAGFPPRRGNAGSKTGARVRRVVQSAFGIYGTREARRGQPACRGRRAVAAAAQFSPVGGKRAPRGRVRAGSPRKRRLRGLWAARGDGANRRAHYRGAASHCLRLSKRARSGASTVAHAAFCRAHRRMPLSAPSRFADERSCPARPPRASA